MSYHEECIVSLDTLPKNSKEKYERQHELFLEWCTKIGVTKFSEDVLMDYFTEMAEKYSPSSLWSYYFMLKATLNVKDNFDISSYKKIVLFLKQKSEGHTPKKSKTLSQEEVITFLLSAPDNMYLMMKVCVIFGIVGACRSDELMKLSVDDIEDKESILIIHMRKSKTNRPRTFIVTADFEEGIKPIELYRRYLALRPSYADNTRFFLLYRQGKCTAQPVGIHNIEKIPSKIASYLNLPDALLYTGHCFRRTSATLFANAGGSKMNLKHHGGCKSDTIPKSYVKESVLNTTKIAKTILGGVHQQPAQSETFADIEILENSEMETNPNACLIGEDMEKEKSHINDKHDMDIPMSSICAVPGCSSRSNRELDKRFYSFPCIRDNRGRIISKGYQRRKLWLQALNRHDLKIQHIGQHLNVCSDHFVLGRPSEMGDMNNVDYVPSLNLECDVSRNSTGFIGVVKAAKLFDSNNFSSQINWDDESDFCPNAFRFECTFSISGDVSTQAFIPKVDIFERKPPETAAVSEPEFFDCSPIPVNNAIIIKKIQDPILVKMIPVYKPIILRTKTLSEDLSITNELEKETRKLQQLETIKHGIIDEVRASKEEIDMEHPMEIINVEIKTEDIQIKQDVNEIFPN